MDQPNLLVALERVRQVMASAEHPWWVIGSAAVWLHTRRADDVRDIDVLMDVRDAGRVLPALGLTICPGPDHPKFRSAVFAPWRCSGVDVEFMAGLEVFAEGKWHVVAARESTSHPVADGHMPVPDRDELRRILRLFGRQKDLRREAMLG